ncbi:MAG: 4Fe-4S cluster-binding domain-containing protein, partial [Euryarchaeota archaeon]|nr:4Fe-4S cluster-binding domain-containing protein [Euryarchaeota archaeon]
MRLIALRKSGDQARIEFYGCPLRCGYCTHVKQPRQEYDLQRVLEFVADPKIAEVYLGGAEPTLQKRDLKDLLERLKRMGKRA